jgi:hypothetical protein
MREITNLENMNTIERSAIQKQEGRENSKIKDVEKGDSLGAGDVTGQYSYLTFDVCN